MSINNNMIQASIEFFGVILCILEITLFATLTNERLKSRRFLMLASVGNIVMLLSDIIWNIFDGDTASFAFFVNKATNLGTFLSNAFVVAMATHYIYESLLETGKKPGSKFFIFELILTTCALVMPLSNLVYPWLYSFTEDNNYYRLTGWYAYTLCIVLALVSSLIYIVYNRKLFDKFIFWSLLAFYSLPCLGSILQAFFGGAFINLGVTIGLLNMGFAYIKQWIETGKKDSFSQKKNSKIFAYLFVTMLICVIAILFASMFSLNSTYVDQYKSSNYIIAQTIDETVEHSLTEPVVVASTMANSSTLKQSLANQNLESGSVEEKDLINYLASIKDGLGYQMAFATSSSSLNYYTYEGLSKHLDLQNNSHDVWYFEIWDSDEKYVLNIDTDEVNGMTQAVFVNMKVYDDNNNPIGICGVGVPMETLQQTIVALEEEYDLKIQLVNKDGLVQVDSCSSNIETQTLDASILEAASEDTFTYIDSSDTIQMTKALSDFGWYIVITMDKKLADGFTSVILPSIIVTILGLVIMFAIYMLFLAYGKSMEKAIAEKEKLASVDELTGLYNRYALEKYRKDIHQNGWKENLAIITMDVNGLKSMNDQEGHAAGDELIKATAACIRLVSDNAFRTGGDEFRIYNENFSKEDLDATLSELKAKFSACKGQNFNVLSVSIGAVLGSQHPDLTLDELEELADENMYNDKSEYYRKSNKDRRKS